MSTNVCPTLLSFNGIKPPAALSANGNLSRNWCTWRHEFLTFLKEADPQGAYKDGWGKYLLMFIGPVGQQAYNTLSFDKISDKENFNLLLKKLDIHFVFGTRSRQRKESIDEYTNNLMHIAISNNYNEFQDIVKEKVVEDLKNIRFTGEAQTYLNTLGNNLELHLQSLNLSGIISVWKQCERLMYQNNEKLSKKQNNDVNRGSAVQCIRCGSQHLRNKCPAFGKQCSNCKRLNHFTERCTVQFVVDCPKCGTDHVQSRCIAFGQICSKCGKSNHFSEKCQAPNIKDCPRCGTDHVVTACPAQGKLCPRCNKPNHLERKCTTKLSDT